MTATVFPILFYGILLIPLISTGVLFIPNDKNRRWLRLTWVVEILLLALLWVVSPESHLPLPFILLGSHPMGFLTSRFGIEFALILALGGFSLSLTKDMGQSTQSAWHTLLNLWMFALALMVLFAADFLTRILALELSAACLSLYPLAETNLPLNRRWMHVIEIYLPLRIAGVFLIAVIFPLALANQDFQIQSLLDTLAGNGFISQTGVILLMLAVAIKSGTVPFSKWLVRSLSMESEMDWAYSGMVITSSLAFYLLYRFSTLLPVQPGAYLIAALVMSVIAMIRLIRSPKNDHNDSLFHMAQNFPTALLLIANGNRAAVPLFILVMSALMIFWMVLPKFNNKKHQWRSLLETGIIFIVRFLFPILVLQFSRQSVLEKLLVDTVLISQVIFTIRANFSPRNISPEQQKVRVRTKEEQMERSGFREWTQSFVDIEFQLDHLTRYVNQFLRKISRTINKLHNDSLERYLYWTAFFFLLIFVFVFMV